MKKIIIFSISILGLFLLIRIYFIDIQNDLELKNEEAKSAWKEVIEYDKKRINYLRNKRDSLNNENNSIELDSVLKSDYFPDECELEYTFKQSMINNYSIKLTNEVKEINQIDSISNLRIQLYNNKAREFNQKASSFPNIIVSRRNHFKRKVVSKVVQILKRIIIKLWIGC